MKRERKSQIQSDHNQLKLWPRKFIKKNIQISAKSAIPMIEIKKYFPKQRDKRERFYKIFWKTNRQQHLIQWKKTRAEFKILAQKNKKEDWEKFASSLNYNTPINQALKRVRQLKGKDLKKSYYPWSQWSTIQRHQKLSQ